MKLMIPKITWLVFLTLCLAQGVAAQNPGESYFFKSLENGPSLSNGNVLTILKDSDGFMWFGTAYGLNRFDGTKMQAFYSDERDSTTLSDNYISKIYEGPDKNLWIKNVNGKFDIYLSRTGIFERNITKFTEKYGLKSDQIKMVFKDEERFWFVHPSEGISVYDVFQEQTTFLEQQQGVTGSMSSNQVSSIAKSRLGVYWVVHQNGTIDILNGENWKVTDNLQIDRFQNAAVNYDFEIFLDSEQAAWI